MTSVDITAVGDLLIQAGREIIMPRFRRLEAHDVREKSQADLVTVADEEAEAFLTPRLEALLPGSRTVGEEAVGRNPALLDQLRQPGLRWLIDPISGTSNFAAGWPFFASMIALILDGDAVASWILDVPGETLVTASKGEGAWLMSERGYGMRLQMTKPPSLAHLSGAANLRMSNRSLVSRLAHRLDRTAGLMCLRCLGLEYLSLAQGQLHYGIYSGRHPWDFAPGSLLITEAGGVAKRLDGRSYCAADPLNTAPLLLACGEEQWDWLKREIFDP
ncbi:inositol monophosphatase family protein [Ferrovibrio sp.]|uniref:inositol monophosphatase family protein n=1 Tax=Ferrovibrio sp. TaxID=1917215 RepID=UPI000CC8DE63|nr:inositol monophosphatase family protein [Ferrovibrio sp.]PJI37879.1 MAG: inositol-1-monophosphatase [Ferrovibrio sp.]